MCHTVRVPKELRGRDSGSEGDKQSMQGDPRHAEAPANCNNGGEEKTGGIWAKGAVTVQA